MTAEEVQAGQIVLNEIAPFVVGVFTKRHPEEPDWTFATGTAIEFKRGEIGLDSRPRAEQPTVRSCLSAGANAI